jgi:hypothetical protein
MEIVKTKEMVEVIRESDKSPFLSTRRLCCGQVDENSFIGMPSSFGTGGTCFGGR